MTNVPETIRNALADCYKLFDVSYLMDGSDDDWKLYWDRANVLIQKYGDGVPLLQLLEGYSGIIVAAINERKTGNKSLLWNPGEEYPHPGD